MKSMVKVLIVSALLALAANAAKALLSTPPLRKTPTGTLRAVLENDYFSRNLVDSWSKPNTHMGKPMVCSQKCGKEFDAFAEQFK